MANIFISYAREDRPKAQQLARVFEERGWSVWWDTRLRAGEMWDEVIEAELRAARCVVVLWSQISVGKHWVKVEANDGLQRGILVPALIENVRPPLAFRLVQAEFLIDWSGERSDAGLVRLLAAIGDLLERQSGEPYPRASGPIVGAEQPNEWPPGKVFRDIEALWCPELVVVPAGEFLMGSSRQEEGQDNDEWPQHQVSIGSCFALGRYAVTVGEYRYFVEASGRRHQGGIYMWTGSKWRLDSSKSWQDPGFDQTERHPVVGVSWEDAQAYVAWLAQEAGKLYRLPSETEWEYACRAGSTTQFSFGKTITTDQANCDGRYVYSKARERVRRTTEVGSFPARAYSICTATSGSGWKTCGTIITRGRRLTGLRGLMLKEHPVAVAFCAGAPGTIIRKISAPPTAAGTYPPTAITVSGSALPGRLIRTASRPSYVVDDLRLTEHPTSGRCPCER